ncbi:stromelysin-1-like isoform X2 [Hemitrygon akajei]|uniref:stromelysin-1-like isoform X2 n=1 Tax=Hemitrygon akajei TaxID=2704970 RepID=UPI003BF9B4D9
MKCLSLPINFLLVNTVLSLPVYPHDEENEITRSDFYYAQKYIKQFFTLEDSSESFIQSEGSLPNKIKEVQEFYGLRVTGKLDLATIELMTEPRCGVPDLASYSLYPGKPRWNKAFVTYSVVNYIPQLSFFEIEYAIWRAVNIWQKVIPLNLVRVFNTEADIMISFETRVHGDNFPFDGRGGTLAHAFSPGKGIGGDIHFDREENWTWRRNGTIQVFHQESAQPQMQDRRDPSISFDAVTKAYGIIFLFKNGSLWHKDLYTADVKVSSIQDTWLDLPSNIDAACEIPGEDIIYFFKGSKFWTYTHNKLSHKSPQSIYLFGLPPYVKQIDAALFIQQAKKIFFFVGKMYWSYNTRIKTVDQGYPKWISSRWSGVNDKIDAALQNDGLVYFFSGPQVYEYNFWRKETLHTLNSNQWLGCQHLNYDP